MKKLFLLAQCFILLNVIVTAQSSNQVLSMDVVTETIGNNFSFDSLPVINDSTIYQIAMNLSLYDTTNIQEIEIGIGTTEGSSDLIFRNFSFDDFSPGSGFSYSRQGFNIQLGLGTAQGISSFFSSVRLKLLDGSYSPIITFNR